MSILDLHLQYVNRLTTESLKGIAIYQRRYLNASSVLHRSKGYPTVLSPSNTWEGLLPDSLGTIRLSTHLIITA